jgi:hypothetical protein
MLPDLICKDHKDWAKDSRRSRGEEMGDGYIA